MSTGEHEFWSKISLKIAAQISEKISPKTSPKSRSRKKSYLLKSRISIDFWSKEMLDFKNLRFFESEKSHIFETRDFQEFF